MKCSKQMQEYFDKFENDTLAAYEIAQEAKKKGIDPSTEVEVTLAKTLSDRVIGLISVLAPQLKGSGAPKRIRELEEEYGILDWRVALKIAEDVAREKFCEFESKERAIEVGIRTGFAYVTLGVVSAPIEGFTSLNIKKTNSGEDYFCLNYSGPIRNAGGTAAAVSVIIGDYLRKVFGYAEYDPTKKEVQRCHAELRDYHERVTNLQYFPSEKESEFMMENLPVEINGDPSEKYEVSNVNLKGLSRIKTDVLRSGYCLIHSSCLPLKAPKLWKRLEEWGDDFGMEHWSFLEKFIKIQKESKSGGEKSSGKLSPDYTYIKDLVSGRPVLGHPLKHGGFRIRYGRCRNTGMSAQAIHPATMVVLDEFIAVGTQVKTERPGKAASMMSCDTIEGPIVKLRDGSVHRLETEKEAKKHAKSVKEILYLGDVLVSYGDFLDRAHPLVPVGYTEEHWKLEVEKAAKDNKPDIERFDEIMDDPLNCKFIESVKISKSLGVPLHPRYTYFWTALDNDRLGSLMDWVQEADELTDGDYKLRLPNNPGGKRALELVGVPHILVNDEFVVIKGEWARALKLQMGNFKDYGADLSEKDSLGVMQDICPVKLRDKAGTFMGSRMGRPEKAKLRKLKGDPHCLFPVGEEGGRRRSIQSALDEGKITSEFKIYKCENCGEIPFAFCPDCEIKAEEVEDEENVSKIFEIDVGEHLTKARERIGMRVHPDLIKGVRGTLSKEHHSEDLTKGLLRAHYNLHVNKDGTIRYDCSELPITHFKPEEIGVPVKKLRSLGYKKDIHGNSLKTKDQVLEIKPQDIIIPCCPESPEEMADDIMYRTTQFIDDLLTKVYDKEKYYDLDSKKDLVGHYIVGLAPHTSAGMLGRIIGFSQTQGFLAHPLFHAAMRRDCDGDESCFLLLMDSFLNFSQKFLPASRGATMDAPLVLTLLLNPAEVDDMVFNMDISDHYPLELYEAAQEMKMPWEVKVKTLGDELGEDGQFEGMMYTHGTKSINDGVLCSAYKNLPSMEEKLKGQMALAEKIRAVKLGDVARLVIEKHFIRDTKGNLRKFSQQQFRCVKCNEKYNRPPLVGKCEECGGRLIFTVSKGFITKYLEPSLSLVREFRVPFHLQQSMDLLKRRVEEVFGREKEKQEELGQWFG